MPRPRKEDVNSSDITDQNPITDENPDNSESVSAPSEKTVEVSLGILEQIQSQLAALKAENEDLKSKTDILEKAANKVKMARLKPKDEIGLNVRIGLFRQRADQTPKVVTGWQMVKNFVRVVNGEEHCEQEMELFLEGGEKINLNYDDFYLYLETDEVELDVEKSKFIIDSKGTRRELKEAAFTYNGKEYKIPAYAVNPR